MNDIYGHEIDEVVWYYEQNVLGYPDWITKG